MKIRKESAFQAEEIMIYLKDLRVILLKHSMCMFLWVCVYV